MRIFNGSAARVAVVAELPLPAVPGRQVAMAAMRYIRRVDITAGQSRMDKKPIRVSHVAVPANLSVLKLKSHLRTAIADVARDATDNEILLVKVLVPQILGLKAGEKLFDKVLQGIVDKHSRVRRVSVEFVDGEITADKIAASEARTQQEIDAYGHLLEEDEPDESAP